MTSLHPMSPTERVLTNVWFSDAKMSPLAGVSRFIVYFILRITYHLSRTYLHQLFTTPGDSNWGGFSRGGEVFLEGVFGALQTSVISFSCLGSTTFDSFRTFGFSGSSTYLTLSFLLFFGLFVFSVPRVLRGGGGDVLAAVFSAHSHRSLVIENG